MENNNVKLKWKIVNHTVFTSEHEGYLVTVSNGKWCLWDIVKDGKIVDAAQYHNPTHNELSAKIQAEKCLNEILNKNV